MDRDADEGEQEQRDSGDQGDTHRQEPKGEIPCVVIFSCYKTTEEQKQLISESR